MQPTHPFVYWVLAYICTCLWSERHLSDTPYLPVAKILWLPVCYTQITRSTFVFILTIFYFLLTLLRCQAQCLAVSSCASVNFIFILSFLILSIGTSYFTTERTIFDSSETYSKNCVTLRAFVLVLFHCFSLPSFHYTVRLAMVGDLWAVSVSVLWYLDLELISISACIQWPFYCQLVIVCT